MTKVFLYLYPIKEYTSIFYHEDEDYDVNPLSVLNETIDKRYRAKGYKIVYALYPGKTIYGIDLKDTDGIIYTDVSFNEATSIDENGKNKTNFVPKYPSEQFLLNQLGDIEELIVGGYHFRDCVRRVAECAYENGITTLVDLDLTDLFFNLYNIKDYFRIDEYDPHRYRELAINKRGPELVELYERIFDRNYTSPVYGLNKDQNKNKKI